MILKSKTSGFRILITVIAFLFMSGGFLFLLNKVQSKAPPIFELPIIVQSVPMPTDIDQNFLTQVNECFIATATIYGYTLRISSGFRTVEEQDQLYNQGRTINGHIVTEAPGGKSIHNYGFAVDVVDRWHEYNIDWKKLGKIATFCGLEPSDEGDISHFEYRSGLTTADFIAGRKPEPLILPCTIMNERAKVNQLLTFKDLQNCGVPKF
jgi:hypothetical protein